MRGERIGLRPCSVHDSDEQLPQLLLKRVRHDGRFQFSDHDVDVTESQTAPSSGSR